MFLKIVPISRLFSIELFVRFMLQIYKISSSIRNDLACIYGFLGAKIGIPTNLNLSNANLLLFALLISHIINLTSIHDLYLSISNS